MIDVIHPRSDGKATQLTPHTPLRDGALSDPMATRPFIVLRARKETYDTVTLELEPRDGTLFTFAPGQFNMLYVFGVGEVPISISGDPANPRTLLHTIRDVGAVSHAICSMKRGDVLGVRGPYGTSWPVQEALGKDVVVVTGGIALPPLRPFIYHVLNNRAQYGRFSLLYGARTPLDMMYTREVEEWRSRFDFDVEVTVDAARNNWFGHVGVVTTLMPRIEFDSANAVAAVCGPEIMMRYAVMELEKRGLTGKDIYVSMERNMKCGVGFCGHCQLGSHFVCKDGPVFRFDRIERVFTKREI